MPPFSIFLILPLKLIANGSANTILMILGRLPLVDKVKNTLDF